MNVGRVIKAAREKAKISQAVLAERCDVSVSTVCEWEASRYNPSSDRLPVIAKALSIGIEELFA